MAFHFELFLQLYTTFYTGVRQGETAEVFHNGQWHPICGHYFWNNGIGANLYCQQLGYDLGEIRPESTSASRQVALPSDGIRIGMCNEGDTWLSCTGGCNDLSVGGDHCSNCQAGAMAGLQIDCFNGKKIW